MFKSLTERLTAILSGLSGAGRLSERDVDVALREVRVALLEADVNLGVVKEFIGHVRERAMAADLSSSLTPGQVVVKIVLEQMTDLLGGGSAKLVLGGRIPAVVLLVGLQGSGKTTASAKLANVLRKQGKRPMLIACDLYRPAAVDQLVTLGRQLDIPVFSEGGSDPAIRAKAGVRAAIDALRDVAIIDTAGRLHIDDEMMAEAARIRDAVRPDQVLMVIDAMTGQDAVTSARAFRERVGFDGVIVTKLDGDARGGAALSVKSVTGVPIMFAGVGEGLDALEEFHPDRMAKRILGMGDVVTLIEKAREAIDAERAAEMEERLRSSSFTFDDYLAQLQQVKKMGGLGGLVKMLPSGILPAAAANQQVDEGELERVAAIILSMTAKERANPKLINGSRRERIARGSGVTVSDVNRMIKQFDQVRAAVKKFGGSAGGKGRRKRTGRTLLPGMRFPL